MIDWSTRVKLRFVTMVGLLVIVAVPCVAYFVVGRERLLTKAFLNGLLNANAAQLRNTMHPDAVDFFDDPMLEAMARGVRKRLGDWIRFEPVTLVPTENERGVKEIVCRLFFDQGTGFLNVSIVEGKVIDFFFQSPELPRNWRPVPETPDYWAPRGAEFLKAYCELRMDDAYRMMFSTLKRLVSKEQLKADVIEAREKAGDFVPVEFLRCEWTDESHEAADYHYKLVFETKTRNVVITFEFGGLEGQLVGLAPEKDR
jgi:hypothetical protein